MKDWIKLENHLLNIPYTSKGLQNIINLPLLTTLDSKSQNWSTRLEIVLRKFISSKDKEGLCFLIVGKIDQVFVNKFKNSLIKIIGNNKYLITSDLIEANKFNQKILLTSNGSIGKLELMDIMDMIKFQEYNPLGWIFIDKFNLHKLLT